MLDYDENAESRNWTEKNQEKQKKYYKEITVKIRQQRVV